MKIHALPPFVLVLALAATLAACGADQPAGQAPGPPVSGRLQDGLRVLTFDPVATGQRFVVFRGDYVRPETPDGSPLALEIPALQVAETFPPAQGGKDFFKVTEPGTYPFRTAGGGAGVIEAIEFQATSYREVNSAEAARWIADARPLILDVRTAGEFAEGHLEGAVLIPVQALQQRLGELEAHREDPILVYCRSGNRSTVAAKLMVDAGFTQVVNLRRGIVEWIAQGQPVVR